MTTTQTARPSTAHRTSIRAGAAATAGAAALAAWALMTGPFDLDLQARVGPETVEVGPVSIVVSALIAGLGAWAVAALVERRAEQPRRRWLQVALVVAVASMGGPLVNAVGTGATVGLGLLHVLTAVIVVPAVTATVPETGRNAS